MISVNDGNIDAGPAQTRFRTGRGNFVLLRIAIAAILILVNVPSFAADTLRIGLQKTGTFAWQLDVIKRHGLASAANLDLKLTEMSSADAGKLALNAGSVDVAGGLAVGGA